MKRNEKGNVLFFILIGVALFAALSFAVTQSSRTGPGTIQKERASLLASEFIQYGTALEQAVSRMIIAKGVPDYGIDVSATGISYSAANATCATARCRLFDPAGGGIQGRKMPDEAFDPSFPTPYGPTIRGFNVFRYGKIVGVGSDLNDLVVTWYGIKKEICLEINRKLGIPDWQNPQTDDGTVNFTGTYTSFPTSVTVLGDDAPNIAGRRGFCVYYSGTWGYAYYQVLWAR